MGHEAHSVRAGLGCCPGLALGGMEVEAEGGKGSEEEVRGRVAARGTRTLSIPLHTNQPRCSLSAHAQSPVSQPFISRTPASHSAHTRKRSTNDSQRHN